MTFTDIMEIWSQPAVLRLAGFGVLSVLLWRLPLLGMVFYPFRLLNTYIHELSHGVAAVLTGGEFHRFTVNPNREGEALIRGGNIIVIGSAGYLGSAAFGAGMLFLTASDIASTTILLILGISLALLCLLFVRNLFGIVAGFVLACALVLAALYVSGEIVAALVVFLAIQLSLSALDTLVIVLRLSAPGARSARQSDAHILARHTGVPAIVWALFWSLASLGLMLVAVTAAYSDSL